MNEILDLIYSVVMSIGLKFNLNKCKSSCFIRDNHDKYIFKLGLETIPALEKDEKEMYLGIPGNTNICIDDIGFFESGEISYINFASYMDH